MGLGSPDWSEPGGGPARPQGLATPDASHLRQGEWAPDFPGVNSD